MWLLSFQEVLAVNQVEPADRHDDPAPHELANELTRDPDVKAESSMPQTQPPPPRRDRDMLPAVERQVVSSILLIALACMSVGLVIASILFHSVAMVIIAAVFIVPFMALVSAPVWLASTTKLAQDQTVREQRRETV